MNGLEIAVLGIFALFAFTGYQRGFLRMVYSLASWVIVLVFVTWATPYLADFLEKNTNIKDFVQERCADYIEQMAENEIAHKTGESEIGQNSIAGMIGGVLAGSGLYEEAADGIAHFVMRGIAFFIATALVGIITFWVFRMLNVVSHIPAIRGPDKILGAAAGVFKGIVLVWLLFFFIRLGIGGEFGQQCLAWVKESRFLGYLYENNMLMEMALRFIMK